jgi:hypothetical protein
MLLEPAFCNAAAQRATQKEREKRSRLKQELSLIASQSLQAALPI